MSVCPSCGAFCAEDTKTCFSCGATLEGGPALNSEEHLSQEEDSAFAAESFYASEGAQRENASYQSAPQTPQSQHECRPPRPTSDGVISLAWNDLKSSKGWFGKLALLALITCVPILNFVVLGYEVQWGRRAAFRASDSLPRSIFEDRTFSRGFFVFLILLVANAVMSLCGIIPVVGMLSGIIVVPIALLACIRMAVTGDFGDAFNLGNIFDKFKSNVGGCLFITFIPSLVLGAVIVLLLVVLGIVFGVSYASLIYGYLPVLSTVGLVASIAGMYVCLMASVAANLVIFRAFGYWVSRFAPIWVQESYVKGNQVL